MDIIAVRNLVERAMFLLIGVVLATSIVDNPGLYLLATFGVLVAVTYLLIVDLRITKGQ